MAADFKVLMPEQLPVGAPAQPQTLAEWVKHPAFFPRDFRRQTADEIDGAIVVTGAREEYIFYLPPDGGALRETWNRLRAQLSDAAILLPDQFIGMRTLEDVQGFPMWLDDGPQAAVGERTPAKGAAGIALVARRGVDGQSLERVMRQYPQRRGELVGHVADILRRFHNDRRVRSSAFPAHPGLSLPRVVAQRYLPKKSPQLFAQARRVGELCALAAEEAVAFVHSFLHAREDLFAERFREGYWQELHGNLSLNEIQVTQFVGVGERVLLCGFDNCSLQQRRGDPLSDVAHFAVELEARAFMTQRRAFEQSYAVNGLSYSERQLYRFYVAAEALQRMRRSLGDVDETGRCMQPALAQRFALIAYGAALRLPERFLIVVAQDSPEAQLANVIAQLGCAKVANLAQIEAASAKRVALVADLTEQLDDMLQSTRRLVVTMPVRSQETCRVIRDAAQLHGHDCCFVVSDGESAACCRDDSVGASSAPKVVWFSPAFDSRQGASDVLKNFARA